MTGRGRGRGCGSFRGATLGGRGGTGHIVGGSVPGVGLSQSDDSGSHDTGGDLCGQCEGMTDDGAIGCDDCDLWFHPTVLCMGLPLAAITQIQQLGGAGLKFSCTSCRSKEGTSVSKDSFTQLFRTVRELCKTVKHLSIQVQSLHSGTAGPVPSVQGTGPAHPASFANVVKSDAFKIAVREEAVELEEQRKRKDSVIVKGITLDESDDMTADFKARFDFVCNRIIGATIPVTDLVKIDGDGNRPPMFRCKILNPSLRKRLLDKARDLKDHDDLKSVFIQRDLTYKQRQTIKARRRTTASQMAPPPQTGSGGTTPDHPTGDQAAVSVSLN